MMASNPRMGRAADCLLASLAGLMAAADAQR